MPLSESPSEDRVLLARWCSERSDAVFAELVERHRPLVTAICRRELHDAAEADDVVQEVFIALAAEAERIRGEPGAWLRTVTLRRCLNHVRARQRRRARETRSLEPGTGEILAASEDEELVSACLAELDDRDRDLLVRLFFLGHTQAEVARSTNLSAVAVHRRTRQALEALRTRFTRRRRPITLALLALLLAGGDRALAAGVLGTTVAGGWMVAAAVAAAAAVAVTGALALSPARSQPPVPPVVPATAAATVAPPPASVTAAAAAPASAAASLPVKAPSAALPVPADDWGVRAPTPVPTRVPAGDRFPLDLAALKWQDFASLRVMVTEPGQEPTGTVYSWDGRSEVLTASRYATPVPQTGPENLHLPPVGYRLVPPPGRHLVVYRTHWRLDVGREQVKVAPSVAADAESTVWGLSRRLAIAQGQERSLSVIDLMQLDADGRQLGAGTRRWWWREASNESPLLLLVNQTVNLAGWAVQPLPPATAQRLLTAYPQGRGSEPLAP